MPEGAIVTLIATLHDADHRQRAQARLVVGLLQSRSDRLVVLASPVTSQQSADLLRAAGVIVEWQAEELHGALGHIRLAALAHGRAVGAAHLHLCDWDRV